MKRLFSIIVPVYNGEKTIEKCVQSVIHQTYSYWELIIVNDGSTDGTDAVIEKYASDKRIIHFKKRNEGVSSARNSGLAIANGEYIIFLDADDSLSPDACETFFSEMDSCDFCIAGFYTCSKRGCSSVCFDTMRSETIIKTGELSRYFANLYKAGLINSPWAKCYKKDMIQDLFKVSLNLGEDLLFNLSYIEHCSCIMVIPNCIYYYNIQTSGSLSSSILENGFKILDYVYAETLLFLDKQKALNIMTQDAVDEKYALDYINMLERHVRFNSDYKNSAFVREHINNSKAQNVLKRLKLNKHGIKWEIERRLLAKEKYSLFCVFTKSLLFVRKMTMKEVN